MPSLFRRSSARLIALGLSCAAFVSTQSVSAADCNNSPIHEAFAVEGLKSELMVTALSCKTQDQYNAFVAKFRPQLTEAEHSIDGYFRSTYGRRAQSAHDDYITQLADIQSLGGLKSGTIFCQQREAMFDEINSLETGADLAHYAAAKDVAQPASFESCSSSSSERHSRHGIAHRSSRKRSHRS
ncbi:hypothetical protein [Swingsia samuiensis]|uniref:DUF1311 domain-containing protein n=1 Tax=Swingsia samuiensis TaxID=1293412 RepID=A0A4Y6UGP0_9PROT|nr:hypothetical protein [Swingsia samuiensis]QDH16742.1 hypothetical protein E3D00_03545 [Swingsia samuiensis]